MLRCGLLIILVGVWVCGCLLVACLFVNLLFIWRLLLVLFMLLVEVCFRSALLRKSCRFALFVELFVGFIGVC